MRSYYRRFAASDLDGLGDSRDAFVGEALHFLFVVDQRAEAADGLAVGKCVFDHLDGAFDAETKSIFICQQNLHIRKPVRFLWRKILYNFTRWMSLAKPCPTSVDFWTMSILKSFM